VSSPFFHEQAAKEGNVKRIRWGEAAATAIVVATGAAVSYGRPNNHGLWVSIAIAGIFVLGYEYMIAHPATDDTSSSAGAL
jgi:hypothetical protein